MPPRASDSPSSSHNTKSSMSSNKDQQPSREQKQSRRSGRSSRRNKDLSGSFTGARPSNGGPSGVSQPSAADRARQQQRRRPTNYTSSYTPPPGSLSRPSSDGTSNQQQSQSSSGIKSSSRRKCSSLDRSEEEGDARRRHLKSGGTLPTSSTNTNTTNEPLAEAANVIGGLSEQVQQRREQLQLQAMQAQLRLEREQLQHAQLQERQAFAQQERERQAAALQAQQQQQQGSSESRSGSSSRKLKSGVSSSRRKSEERESSVTTSSNNGGSPRKSSSSRSSRKSGERKSSHRRSSRDESNNTNNADTSERTEQQRIEEYAGKRALLRLEQELADHSESNANAFSRSNSFSRDSSGDQEIYKSVMDRKKLARVPQVKKSDLIIGEYLGRGNFCDVFEITWIPEQTRSQSWNKSTQSFTYDTSQSGDDMSERSLENSMENLALSCSNDLNLVSDPRNGGITKSASRRSVSQVVGTGRGSFMGGGMSNSAPPSGGKGGGRRLTIEGLGSGGNLRNPNVLALKCLRPAVRAQPRKFVIGAEDLAHETALLACLDHPNIIQLYGRAEGCFSTAFQMRNKNGSNDNPSKNDKGEGKQMSNEGYFIILDRLMTTLTDRNDEWKDECRAINGVGPPPEGMPLPPESTLREHLCKRLKVAYCIADALEYLHSRHVVFRDLKPANVGFDCNDCVKMFDFGFATSIAPLLSQPYEGYGPLTETCGTRRYMATEVALKLGYGKEVDVYSFGMLLWEICALDKPFDSIQSVDEFHDLVVLCGRRPSLNIDPLWTPSLKNLMSRCWSTDPLDRPTMVQVKSLLCNVLRDMNKAMEKSGDGRVSARGGGTGSTATHQQRQEQGGNFMHKWRRRVSI